MKLICECCHKVFDSERRSKRFCSRSCANKSSADKRTDEMNNKESVIVWSSGGGIQSTAIAVLIYQGRLPKPDYSLMIDCGYESARTIDYIKRVIIPKMSEVGVEFNLIPSSDYVTVELMDDRGYCNLPAYRVYEDGRVSHLSTRCNGTWKQTVMRKWLRERGVEKAIDWVGISTDESRRADKTDRVKWITNAYPLLDLNLSRTDCVQLIKNAGWEMPLRTSCIMCPQRTTFEWLKLKMDCPEDFDRACAIEKEMQRVDERIWLTPFGRPLAEVVESE